MKKTLSTVPFLMGALLVLSTGCKKDDTPAPPSEIAEANLISKFSFEGDFKDSKTGSEGTGTNTSFITGLKGKAYQGSANGFVSFANTPNGLESMRSFTTAMWINTAKHSGGIQALFALPNTNSWFGNMLIMIDQNTSTSDSMNMKVYFEKNVTPAIGWYGQYIDLYGEYRLPNMYGQWKHVAFSYDALSSKFAAYLDGQPLTLDPGMTDRYTDDPNSGGVPLGPLSFANVSKFIIGGYQNHLGSPWSAPDPEMLTYTGALDELRIYDKALAASEINAMFKLDSGN